MPARRSDVEDLRARGLALAVRMLVFIVGVTVGAGLAIYAFGVQADNARQKIVLDFCAAEQALTDLDSARIAEIAERDAAVERALDVPGASPTIRDVGRAFGATSRSNATYARIASAIARTDCTEFRLLNVETVRSATREIRDAADPIVKRRSVP